MAAGPKAPHYLQSALSHEVEFYRATRPVRDWIRATLLDELRGAGLRGDADDPLPPRQRALSAVASYSQRVRMGTIPGVALTDVARRVVDRSIRGAGRILKERGFPVIDLAPTPERAMVIEAWAAEAVDTVTGLADYTAARLTKVLAEGLTDGARPETVAKRITEQFGINDRAARFIASDRCSKLNAKIAENAFAQNNASEYEWSTSDDESVRPGHAALDEKTFQFTDPPDTGQGEHYNPGGDWRCRCVALPLLPDL